MNNFFFDELQNSNDFEERFGKHDVRADESLS